MTWLSEVPAGTRLHVIDQTKPKATPLCGMNSGVCVDREDANCSDCLDRVGCPRCGYENARCACPKGVNPPRHPDAAVLARQVFDAVKKKEDS